MATRNYFNTSGSCNSEEHYMMEAATRLHGVKQLIDRKPYFVFRVLPIRKKGCRLLYGLLKIR
ncbi:MAG: hypothetical protein LBH77_09205 [Tannerella sp.]|nr:hypothetical protein [Tannerella sp.]